MPRFQFTVDPDDPSDLDAHMALLARLRSVHDASVEPAEVPSAEVDLRAALSQLLAPRAPDDRRRHGYGENRRAYVRSVASQPYGARHNDVLAAVAAADPDHPEKDHGRAVGGTHASVEAGWNALQLPGATWEGHVLPAEWITYRPERRVHTMDPVVAEVTLGVLDGIEGVA